MKRIIFFLLITIIPSLLLFASEEESSVLPNQWDKNTKTGSEAFEVYFNLADTDTSDLYTDIGFSKTPISNGNITSYDGNTIQATWVSINTTDGVTSVNLSASTYAYWHVVVPSAQTLKLKVTPSSEKVSVNCTFTPYSDGNKVTTKEEDWEEDTVVSFSKAGRFMGSTEITIDATLQEYSFTDDVFCTLTLIWKTT